MHQRKVGLNLLLFFVLAAAITVGSQVLPGPDKAEATRVNPEDVCPGGAGFKDDEAPWEGNIECEPPPDGTTAETVIISAAVKSGNETEVFSIEDGASTISSADGCYTVSGLGTCHVTITGGGTGPDCKEISHVVFCTGTLAIP